MQYVALTQPTCAWLLGHPAILNALHESLSTFDLKPLRTAEFSSGPLRLAGSSDGRLLCIWNREYASGTGSESWGVFKLNGAHGLLNQSAISREVFERLLYIINQRLQGLLIDGDFIHRNWPNGAHTCLAGRGTEARQYSLAYFEGGVGYGGISTKALFAVGPEHDFDVLGRAIDSDLRNFPPLVGLANEILEERRRRPVIESLAYQNLRQALAPGSSEDQHLSAVNVVTEYSTEARGSSAYESMYWTYDQWIDSGTLSDPQRRILGADALNRHPVRVIGPAGSGKTLLMQLLALRYMYEAKKLSHSTKIIYLVHNAAMAQMVLDRLRVLGAEEFLTGSQQSMQVATLSDYGRKVINLSEGNVIDKDASKTKVYQLEIIRSSLKEALSANEKIVGLSVLLTQVRDNTDLFEIFAQLLAAEISTVIKGRGLTDDENRYVDSDTPFSRLHGILKVPERKLVFDCYRRYHHHIFEENEILDSDDVALTLASRLRTPLWNLKRKSEGFDYIFVDEAQLFNENERRIFPYLSKASSSHVPIALALDEAQEPFGFSSAGLATLGITDVESENLPSNHRSTREIVDLAFFIIQQTTDLFGSEFPDFTTAGSGMVPSDHPLASPPILSVRNEEARSFGHYLVKLVQKLRAKNVRQVAVICHADSYWPEVLEAFEKSQLPLHVLMQRGEKISPDQPLVVLSRPPFIGGQEFDAAILVGLEQGVVPPRVADNAALGAALEQQVLREVYLSVTRARYRVIVAVNRGAAPNAIIEGAISGKLITKDK